MESKAATTSSVDGAEAEAAERAVGITVFASPNVPGFKCTIKSRYTDFLVNEILPNGDVLHLTDLNGRHSKTRAKGAGIAKSTVSSDGLVEATNGSAVSDEKASMKRSLPAEENGVTTSSKKQKLEEPAIENPNTMQSDAQADSTNGLSNKDKMQQIIAEIPQPDLELLQSIFGVPKSDEILHLYASVVLHPHRKPRDHATVESEVISEKAMRTEAHVAIRKIFSSKLETATKQDSPGVISIKAAPVRGPSGARAPIEGVDENGAKLKGKQGWDELGGPYLHFTLYKENKDTMEVLYFIASRLKVPAKEFQFAGTKDRRAVTVQRVAIYRVHAARIAELNKSARGWRAGNFEYRKHGLDLGELGGNEFLLTLRDCYFKGEENLLHEQKIALAKKVLESATQSFLQHGFLNYYGLQRFGSFSTGTHVTGQKMLSGDLEGAVNAILSYSDDLLSTTRGQSETNKIPQDDIDRAEAISMWRSGRTKEAVQKMPRRFQAETAIIQFLGKKDRKTGVLVQENDWQGALTQIQRNLRLMYVHAYQSFVWNTVAGKRWEVYGNKAVEGDLVLIGEGDTGPSKDEVDEDGEPVFHPAADDSAPSAEDPYTRARHLSKDEAESGKYSIFDIVLPLPGYDVLYPANTIGKFYEEFMASEVGGGLDPHNMRRSWKDASLSGAYRKMMIRPGNNLSFEVKSYTELEDQMVETDLERIRAREPGQAGGDIPMKDVGTVQADASKSKKIAVVLNLQLGSSQYATMALRELTKGGAANFKPDYSAR